MWLGKSRIGRIFIRRKRFCSPWIQMERISHLNSTSWRSPTQFVIIQSKDRIFLSKEFWLIIYFLLVAVQYSEQERICSFPAIVTCSRTPIPIFHIPILVLRRLIRWCSGITTSSWWTTKCSLLQMRWLLKELLLRWVTIIMEDQQGILILINCCNSRLRIFLYSGRRLSYFIEKKKSLGLVMN